jgi:hypothetical protein
MYIVIESNNEWGGDHNSINQLLWTLNVNKYNTEL